MTRVAAYLARLNIRNPGRPSLEALTRLQRAHMLAVPFENLSVTVREPIILDEPALVAKVVERRRGGFCYELNGAFSWLLDALGYRLKRIEGGVYLKTTRRFGPSFDHMALVVDLGRQYLVDVGFGASAQTPLRIPDSEAEDAGGHFRLSSPDEAPTLLVEQRHPAGWMPQVLFRTQARSLGEFADRCHYHCFDARSSFVSRGPMATRALPNGRITLTHDSLTFTGIDGTKERHEVSDLTAFSALLSRHFGIEMPADMKSWFG